MSYDGGSRIRHTMCHMVIHENGNKVRVTLSLDPIDVALLDRLAALVDSNRSAQVREMLEASRPFLAATVEAYERAVQQREGFVKSATMATLAELEAIAPDVEKMGELYLGAMSRLEGAAAAAEGEDPRPSNHGGHKSDPPAPALPPEDEETAS